MSQVGAREPEEHTGQVLRRVSENNEEIQTLWSDLDRLAAEIDARWPAGITAAEAVSEARREL